MRVIMCAGRGWRAAVAAIVLSGLPLAAPAVAQPASENGGGSGAIETRETTVAGMPIARAFRTEAGPEVDGDVLGDPAYEDARIATGFVQSRPFEGQPASERTEVRIVYTADTLYFGVVCYMEDPSAIITADSRRDSDLRDTDSFQVILDTYHDGLNGFIFGTNAAGVEYDGQVTNEGQGSGRFGGGGSGRPSNSRQQRGSGGGFNLNWDGVWQVATRVTDVGWSAEIAIPFRTLRYPPGEVQTWGMNFQRNIRSRNEQVYWSPLPRQYNLNRLSLAGELEGLSVPAQRNLQLVPYFLGDMQRAASGDHSRNGDFGADLKYSITPSLTLDATYNTDFAQVEVDDEQVNLDRFTLFFPEKRPFFLENAGLFSVGQSGAVDVFFSRRIGIGRNRAQIPIIGGGRLSGKVGNNTNVGFLNMQTAQVASRDDDTIGTPSQNFTVARVRQDLANRSNVGVMFVNRQARGRFARGQDYNRTAAFDGRWGIGEGGTITGFFAQTYSPIDTGIPTDNTHAYALSAQHQSEVARLSLGYTEVAPNFNPEVGFLARRSYRRMNGSVFMTLRPENLMGLHEWRPHVNHFTVFDFHTGRHESQFTHIDQHLEWRNGYQVNTGMNITREGVFQPFLIHDSPDNPVWVLPGKYDHAEAQLAGNTNLGAPVSLNVNSIIGGLFGGNRITVTPSVTARAGETFNAMFEWSYNDLRLPGGHFTTNLARLRVSYSFTTRMFLQALVQYNDSVDIWSSNLRFGLLRDANSGLFIVYNDINYLGSMLYRDRYDQALQSTGRTLTIKYSHLFNVLR